uniref:Tc1-like transposase DDE domain-containing protein n=1 Tax=Glossina pallidipes TaxID=7398 RepID=A0A1A9ZCW1_GLOPL
MIEVKARTDQQLKGNARPYTAQTTVTSPQELELQLLQNPPYSPDLNPTDYHFFRNLDNFLTAKNFNFDNAVKLTFQEFVNSCPPGFYTIDLNNLPLKLRNLDDLMVEKDGKLEETLDVQDWQVKERREKLSIPSKA